MTTSPIADTIIELAQAFGLSFPDRPYGEITAQEYRTLRLALQQRGHTKDCPSCPCSCGYVQVITYLHKLETEKS